ncbi:hypothetical protein COO60DRAFT_1488387 [Scenedesmus sp. NREL 46B-D3]|nr:hypothetical protein COO60DRAFT_1488387 [Scenedesmus sp. NREL 46B-D3]
MLSCSCCPSLCWAAACSNSVQRGRAACAPCLCQAQAELQRRGRSKEHCDGSGITRVSAMCCLHLTVACGEVGARMCRVSGWHGCLVSERSMAGSGRRESAQVRDVAFLKHCFAVFVTAYGRVRHLPPVAVGVCWVLAWPCIQDLRNWLHTAVQVRVLEMQSCVSCNSCITIAMVLLWFETAAEWGTCLCTGRCNASAGNA